MKKFFKYLFSLLLVIPFAFALTACGGDGGDGGGSDPDASGGNVAGHTINFYIDSAKIGSYTYETEEEIYSLDINQYKYILGDPLYYVSGWWINTPQYSGYLDFYNDIDFMSLPKTMNAYGEVSCVLSVEESGIIRGIFDYQEDTLVVPEHVKSNWVDCDITGIETFSFGGENPVSFSSISLPKTISYLGEDAFNFGKHVEVSIDPQNEYYSVVNNCVVENETGKILHLNQGYVLPENLESISNNLFAYKDLPDDFVIPESVKHIGENAFAGWNVENLVIPNTVETIAYGAFKNCKNLKTVTFEEGSKLEYLGSSIFNGCSNIEELTLPFIGETNSAEDESGITRFFSYYDNETYSIKKVTITDAVYIPSYAFSGCPNIEEVYLPNTIESIGEYAFYNCSGLKKVVTPLIEKCPNTIEEIILTSTNDIADGQFRSAWGLKTIVIPEGVESIGNEAFYACSSLTNVSLPSTIKSIGNRAFSYSGIKTINLPDSITSVGANPFEESDLESFVFPKSMTKVPEYFFYGCRELKTVTLHNNITEIGSSAFAYCESLEQIELPTSLTKIIGSAFYACSSLPSINLPKSITYIGGGAFDSCAALGTVVIEDGAVISEIGNACFSDCSALKTFSYTDKTTISKFGSKVFENCTSLTSFKFEDMEADQILEGCTSLSTLEIDNLSNLSKLFDTTKDLSFIENLYITNTENFAGLDCLTGVKTLKLSNKTKTISMQSANAVENIIIEGGLTAVADNTFKDFANLKTIELASSVTSIGNSAFENCTGLTSIVMSGVTTIGDFAFKNTGLTTFVMPENLTTISKNAFANNQIAQVTYNDKIETIDDFAFSNCNLTQIELPSSIKTLGEGVYSGNNIENISSQSAKFETDGKYLIDLTAGENSKKIVIYTKDVSLENVTAIGAYAFKNQDITSFVVPTGVNFIGDGAFEGCESLQSFAFADMTNTTVTIGSYIFRNTPSLKVLKMPFMGSDVETAKSYSGYFNDQTSFVEEIELYTAKTIAPSGLLSCKNLTSFKVQLKDTQTISGGAFSNLTKLTQLDLGNNIESIKNICFAGCSNLTDFNFGEKLVSIGSNSFRGTKLSEAILPEGLVTIEDGVFNYCTNLRVLYIPSTVENVGTYSNNSIVVGCTEILKIYCQETESNIEDLNWQYSWRDTYSVGRAAAYYSCGVSEDKQFIVKGASALNYLGDDTQVVIPDYINYLSETFEGNTLVSHVELHDGVKAIYEKTFNGCTSLTSLYVPISVETIRSEVLLNSGITDVFLEAELDEDNDSAYITLESNWNKLTSATQANFYSGFSASGYANRETLLANLAELKQTKPKFVCSLKNDGVILTSYKGTSSDTIVSVPDVVTQIDAEAFLSNTYITHLYLPDSVHTIKMYAFKGCTNLQFVHIGNGLKTVEFANYTYAPFYNCSNEKLMVYTSLTEDQTANFNEGWDYCVEDFNLPIVYGKTVEQARGLYSKIFEDIETLESQIENMELKLFYGNIAVVSYTSSSSVVLPEEVTAICDKAFYGSNISSITLSSNLKYIGNQAFFGTYISKLFIPKSVERIKGTLFDADSNCKIRCEGSKQSGWAAYWNYRGTTGSGGALETLYNCYYITDNKTGYEALCDSAGKMLEYSGNYKNLIIPTGVKHIGTIFKEDESIETLYIPNTVESIDEMAFAFCYNLKTVEFESESKVTTLKNRVFYDCDSLEYFYIPETITTLEGGVLESCDNLEFVYIPDSVDTIKYAALDYGDVVFWLYPFENNNNALRIFIESSEIPSGWDTSWNSLSSANDEFYDKSIYLDCAKPDLSLDYVLSNDGSTIKAYKLTHSKGIVTPVDSDICAIGDYALYYLREDNNITSFEITQNITQIGKGAFCLADIPYLLLPESVTTFTATTKEEGAFYGFSGDVYASVKEALAGWGEYWQSGNVYLDAYVDENDFGLANDGKKLVKYYGNDINLVIPDTVEEVVEFPKYDYISIKMPGCLDKIPRLFFEGNKILQSIEIGDGLLTVADYAFSGCTSLTSVSLPGTVQSIGDYAFADCTALATVIFNEGLMEVGDYVFKNCTNLSRFYLPSTTTKVGNYAFYGANTDVAVFFNSTTSSPSGFLRWNYYDEYTKITPYLEMTKEDFDNMDALFALLETYKTNEEYADFTFSLRASAVSVSGYTGSATEVVIPEGITSIDEQAFASNTTITSVNLPNSVKSLAYRAFNGCSALVEINLNNVKNICMYAFYGCSALKDVNLTSAELIEYYAFYNTAITYLYISENVVCSTSFYESATPEEVIIYVGFEEGSQNWNSSFASKYAFQYGYTNEDAVENYAGKLERIAALNATEGYEYSLYYGQNMLKAYTGTETSISLPNDVAYVGKEAFSANTTLQEITIPASVEEIMQSAFYNCTSLATVNFATNSNLTTIGYGAFRNCTSLGEMILPSKLKTIDKYAFEGCTILSSVGLPYSLETIGDYAFRNCVALTEISLPDSLISVGAYAFYSTDITSFIFNEGMQIIYSPYIGKLNSQSLKFVYLPSTLTTFPSLGDYKNYAHNEVIVYCNFAKDAYGAKVEDYFNAYHHKFGYTLEEALQDYQAIQDKIAAFAEQGFEVKMYRGQYSLVGYTGTDTKVVVPDEIARIDNRAFYENTTIEEIVLPDGLTTIATYAFYECTNLKTINLPDTLTSIGSYSFAYSGITEIVIPNLVTTIPENTFYNCSSLTTAQLSTSLTTIGDYAFTNASLTELVLPETVTKLGSYCFQGNDFTTVTIPNSVVTMNVGAFKGCANLQSVIISTELTSLSTEVFYGCSSLIEVTIPDKITTIGKQAFDWCTSLETVNFGSGVKSIKEEAFLYCESLTQITLPSSVTSIGERAFAGCSKLEKVFIPKECVTITASSLSKSPFLNCSQTLTIYTDAVSALDTWSTNWNFIATDVYATVVYEVGSIPSSEPETGDSGEEQTADTESGTESGNETEGVTE